MLSFCKYILNTMNVALNANCTFPNLLFLSVSPAPVFNNAINTTTSVNTASLSFPAVYNHQTALVSCFGCLLVARASCAPQQQRVQHNQRVQHRTCTLCHHFALASGNKTSPRERSGVAASLHSVRRSNPRAHRSARA